MDEELEFHSAPKFPELPAMNDEHDFDWDYPMRRQMQEIIPGLFLGPYAVATKKMLPYLQENHITHIVCVRHPLEARTIRANFPDQMQYLVIDLADNHLESIIPYFSKVKNFLDGCLQCQGCALVHGNAGISASATFVIAYLMETFGLKFHDAYPMVQRKRFCVNPSEIFKRQLLEYEAIYLAKLQTPTDHSSGAKRSRDDTEDEMTEQNPCKKTS